MDSENKPDIDPDAVPLESILNNAQNTAPTSFSGVSPNVPPSSLYLAVTGVSDEALWLQPAASAPPTDGLGDALPSFGSWYPMPCEPFLQSFYENAPIPAHFSTMATTTSDSGFAILPYSNAPAGFDCFAPRCAPFETVACFDMLVPQYQHQWVLALSCTKRTRQEAEELGFKKVLLSSDLPRITASVHDADGLSKPHNQQSEHITAILIFSTPHDWCLDLQLALDLLLPCNHAASGSANGSFIIDNGAYGNPPKLYFRSLSSGEAESEFPSRLGVEDFKCAFQSIWLKKVGLLGFEKSDGKI